MRRRGRGYGVCIWLVALALPGQAQVAERKALTALQNEKWETARQILAKVFRKDTARAETWYVSAVAYSLPQNPRYQLDSAHRHWHRAELLMRAAKAREQDRMRRVPVDSLRLYRLRNHIDSLAFLEAQSRHSVQAYQKFVHDFSQAPQVARATELMHEVGYLDALRLNTYTAYAAYLELFPASARASEARERYERRLFEARTSEGRLAQYELFIREFPQSPYRAEAEDFLFQAATREGTVSSFLSFWERYRDRPAGAKAGVWAFSLADEQDQPLPSVPFFDSLLAQQKAQQRPLIAIRKNGAFGFMNDAGEDVLPPAFAWIDPAYQCEAVEDFFLKTSRGLVNRAGEVFSDSLTDVRDLGAGLWAVGAPDQFRILHRGGWWMISEWVADARLLHRRFLAVSRKGRWHLYALNGKWLTGDWDDIEGVSSCLVFSRFGKKVLVTPTQILDENAPDFSNLPRFDDVRAVGPRQFIVTNGALEGLINDSLAFIIPFDRHTLRPGPQGVWVQREAGLQMKGVHPAIDGHTWERAEAQGRWLLLTRHGKIFLFDMGTRTLVNEPVDSVVVDNGLALVPGADSTTVWVSGTLRVRIASGSSPRFVKADQIRYFYITRKGRQEIFDMAEGRKVWTGTFDEVEWLSAGAFLVTYKRQKGLVRPDGRVWLPTRYEAIVFHAQGYFALLSKGKFGVFHPERGHLIEPQYDQNLIPLGDQYWLASSHGLFGWLDQAGRPASPFMYREVQPWNDEACWAKGEAFWQLVRFRDQAVLLSDVRLWRPVVRSSSETWAVFQQHNYEGVVSSKQGVVISPSFTDIYPLGREPSPVFFTEKFVEEASLFIVIYYDPSGKLLRRFVYEEDEYRLVVCDD